MQQTWSKATDTVMEFKVELEELLEILPQSAKFLKLKNSLNKSWRKVQVSLNTMEQFVVPVKSIEVKCSLFSNQNFLVAWQFWKDYLSEQHSIILRSRAELMSLKRLIDITGDDPLKAIYYLEYAMSKLNPTFYKVNEAEEPKKTEKSSSGPMVIKLDPKYYSSNPSQQSVFAASQAETIFD